ncbi:6364_t:CDS:2, partial [Acaulospora colombiana]
VSGGLCRSLKLTSIVLDWALPDQLVYSTVSSLLRLAEKSSGDRQSIVTGIKLVFSSPLSFESAADPLAVINVVTQAYPALHGLYRALISTQFRWTISDWLALSNVISDLLEEDVIDRLNSLVADIVQLNDVDAHLPQTVLSRYIHKDRPLSGYFAVCCVMEIQWTVLAQTLIPWDEKTSKSKVIDKVEDAAAANAAWGILVSKKVVIQDQYSQEALDGLKRTRDRAMECFTDLLAQMGEIEGEPSMDTYAWETMAECLKIASVCSAALQNLDSALYSRLKLLLGDTSPVYDPFVQEAALEATTMLLRNFKSIAPAMISHLRRFVATPLSIFQFEFASDQQMPPVLLATANCLALSIKVASSKSSEGAKMIGSSPYMNDGDVATNAYVETGLRSFTDEEKRLVAISTVCVVSVLAREFDIEE